MVKADPKRNYYADLELTPSATNEEIVKSFRNLAKKFHPDRNPGKEAEFVPKFQAIQAAHEVLHDAAERAKYDADRKRLGYGPRTSNAQGRGHAQNYASTYSRWSTAEPWNSASPAGPTSPYGPYYNSGPNPHPPHPPRQPPTSNTRGEHVRTSTGFSRPAGPSQQWGPSTPGSRPPPSGYRYKAPPTAAKEEENMYYDAFRAFGQKPASQANARKASNASGTSTPKAKKKAGFDPNVLGGDEPSAAKMSGYNTRPRSNSETKIPTASADFEASDTPTREPQRSKSMHQRAPKSKQKQQEASAKEPAPETTKRTPTNPAERPKAVPSKRWKNGSRSDETLHGNASAPTFNPTPPFDPAPPKTGDSTYDTPLSFPSSGQPKPNTRTAETYEAEFPNSASYAQRGGVKLDSGDRVPQSKGGSAKDLVDWSELLHNAGYPFRLPSVSEPWNGFADLPAGSETSQTGSSHFHSTTSLPPQSPQPDLPSVMSFEEFISQPSTPKLKNYMNHTTTFTDIHGFKRRNGAPGASETPKSPGPSIDTKFSARDWAAFDSTLPFAFTASATSSAASSQAKDWAASSNEPNGSFFPRQNMFAASSSSSGYPRASANGVPRPSVEEVAEDTPPKNEPVVDPALNETRASFSDRGAASASTAGEKVKFSEDRWKQTFKTPTFALPAFPSKLPPPAAGAGGRTTSPGKKAAGQRVRSPSKSGGKAGVADAPLGSATRPIFVDDDARGLGVEMGGDAMEIDTPPKLTTPPARAPRAVRGETSKRDWAAPDAAGASSSQTASAAPGLVNVANDNRRRSSARGPMQQQHQQRKSSAANTPSALNLETLSSQLSPESAGISNLEDLHFSLPFESRSSGTHPKQLSEIARAGGASTHPKPPTAPIFPTTGTISKVQYDALLSLMSFYMGAFHRYETQVLGLFAQRIRDGERFGTGTPDTNATRLLNARGEPRGQGVLAYAEALREETQIRERWLAATEEYTRAVAGWGVLKQMVVERGFAKT